MTRKSKEHHDTWSTRRPFLSAYRKGRAAAWAGLGLETNPYHKQTGSRGGSRHWGTEWSLQWSRAWKEGWYDGRKARP